MEPEPGSSVEAEEPADSVSVAEYYRQAEVTARRPFSDPIKAAEAGRKGGNRKAEMAKLKKTDPEAYMFERFGQERAELTTALLDAAYGRGSFAGWAGGDCSNCGFHVEVVVPSLAPDKRLSAVIKGLEYAVGKPQAGKATGSGGAAKPDEPPASGLSVE